MGAGLVSGHLLWTGKEVLVSTCSLVDQCVRGKSSAPLLGSFIEKDDEAYPLW